MYVVTYDNGVEHVWASRPQLTKEAALTAAKIDASQLGCVAWGYTLCSVKGNVATPCDFVDLSPWEADFQFDEGGNYLG